MERRMVVTQRDCPARLVPVGTPITIPKDSFVTITQSLGGSYTVTVNGNMARVDGTDADALGFAALELDFAAPADGRIAEEQVYEALRTVFDPEIPVDIVSLGLVYVCDVLPMADERFRISIKMTVTAPGCGMGEGIAQELQDKLEALPRVGHVEVEIVFDPPWDRSMMSDEAALELGL